MKHANSAKVYAIIPKKKKKKKKKGSIYREDFI
jgi:hypothetical protein